MKLDPRTFRIQYDVHAWAGVTMSIALFVVFFSGIFSLFRTELEIWQAPPLHAAGAPAQEVRWQALLERITEAEAPVPEGRVAFLSSPETRGVQVRVRKPGEPQQVRLVDPVDGGVLPSRSNLSEELYHLHYFKQLSWGAYLAGALAVGLLVLVTSGLLVHLKDLRAQLWRFRPRARVRTAASDAHKVLGVFGLPFTVMMGWTGAVLALWVPLTGVLATGALDGDRRLAAALRSFPSVSRELTGEPATMLPLDEIVDRAREAAGASGQPDYMDISRWGDRGASARVFWESDLLAPRTIAYVDGVTGEVLIRPDDTVTPAGVVDKVMFDVHYAHFGGVLTKYLYALLALGVCAVLVTGNLVWLERRDRQRRSRGNRILARATVGVPVGLAVGIAAAFGANRWLPGSVADPASLELQILYGTWLAVAIAAQIPAVPSRGLAAVGSGLAGVALFAVVGGDLVASGASTSPAIVRVDVLLALLGSGGLAVAWGLRPRRAPAQAASGVQAPSAA